jgi:hypothetical protein
MIIAIIESVLGLVSLGLVVLAWRGRVAAAVGVSVIRVLSALTAVPAFYVGGVPTPIMPVAGSYIILTVVGVVLTLAGLRRRLWRMHTDCRVISEVTLRKVNPWRNAYSVVLNIPSLSSGWAPGSWVRTGAK